MSWVRSTYTPFARHERAVAPRALQLIFQGNRPQTKGSASWVCTQCQSRLRSTSGSPTEPRLRTTRRGKTLLKISILHQARRYASDDSTRKPNDQASQAELPSTEQQRRSTLTKRFSSVMDNMQANIFFAGQRLNDLTGYSGIEKLKRQIQEQEEAMKTAHEQLVEAKRSYAAAIQQRSDSQKEVNELLQRKNSWSPQDLERFTSLYRSDHANEQAENNAKERLESAERVTEETGGRLSSKILARYHEEQIWSDKIRRMSTWGTWGLMGVNVLLFLVFQIGVEPWRRKRLVRGFEEKVIEALETQKQHSNRVTGEALAALQASHAAASTDGLGMILEPAPADEGLSSGTNIPDSSAETALDAQVLQTAPLSTSRSQSWLPGINIGLWTYGNRLEDAFSERQVTIRQVDLTSKLLEGVFAGVMLTSILAAIIRGR